MQKFTSFGKYLLELSFLALLIRFIFFSAEIGISLAIISLVISMAYNKWLEKAKITQYEEIISKLETQKKEAEALRIVDKQELQERIDLAFARIGNLSLDNSIKNVVTSEKSQKLQTPSTKRLF